MMTSVEGSPQSYPTRFVISIDRRDGLETVHGRMHQSFATAHSKRVLRTNNRVLRDSYDRMMEEENRNTPVITRKVSSKRTRKAGQR